MARQLRGTLNIGYLPDGSRSEPAWPGLVYSIWGGGFDSSQPVHIVDTVTYTGPVKDAELQLMTINPLDYIGQVVSIEYDLPIDVAGWISPGKLFLTWQSWGIGWHDLRAYQLIRKKRTLVAVGRVDAYPHHSGPEWARLECHYYAPPPVSPLKWYSCLP